MYHHITERRDRIRGPRATTNDLSTEHIENIRQTTDKFHCLRECNGAGGDARTFACLATHGRMQRVYEDIPLYATTTYAHPSAGQEAADADGPSASWSPTDLRSGLKMLCPDNEKEIMNELVGEKVQSTCFNARASETVDRCIIAQLSRRPTGVSTGHFAGLYRLRPGLATVKQQ
ncbi:hypothetical protein HPP92_007817 [Vanilla planifolia]|uniref:Uncharacterized protein n=1 Tax=Vanilla planifolia TaxID=51239 RepID=A0A835RGQ9_VANPL|nr:hypothetical protein HPP92_007817 [Vanilla planifolia]